jgi:hypothetical protein
MVRLLDGSTRSDARPLLGALGALGLTIAFVALRRSTSRQRGRDSDPKRAFATYLREHLAGADTAIEMVKGLTDAYRGGPEGALFASLYEQFREDRDVVEGILAELGDTSRSVKRLAGRATGSALRAVAGGAPGDLSLFRTLEALAIGVQGKRCLWRAAQALVALPHPPGRRSLVELEADASGRPSSGTAGRSYHVRSASDASPPQWLAAYGRASLDKSERSTWNGFAIAH